MTKFMTGAWLIFKLACQRVDLDRDLFLLMWRSQPPIEIYEPGPAMYQCELEARIDAIFPF